ncbi:MAG: tetratricopeptide repeat protein [Micavibrio aeruginosavorus]|nr:tetratricopeptide repeat protein [Micavibrio aeruginosavorus]
MSASKQVTVDEAFALARHHAQAGNLILADRTFRDILAAVPDYTPALHLLGVVTYQRGNLPEALALLAKAVDLDGDDADAEELSNYAVMLSESGHRAKAIETWERALTADPDNAEAHSNLANALWQENRFDEAESHCRAALRLKPDYTDAMLNLGNALVSLKRTQEAIDIWNEAVRLRPGFGQAWSNIGNALRDLGRLKDSEDSCRRATEASPDHAQSWSNLGNAVRDLGRPVEAEGYYRKATMLQPDFATAHNNLAIALMDQGKFEDAAGAARYAITFDPRYAEGWCNLSYALRETGKLNEAEQAAQRAVGLAPDSPEACIALAEVLYLTDRLDEAEAALTMARDHAPDSPRVLLKLSSVLEKATRTDEALEILDRLIETNPEMPEVFYRKATVHFMINQLPQAQEALSKAMEISPNLPAGLSLRAEIDQALGDMESSAANIRKAIAINPDLPYLYMTLAKTKKFTPGDSDLEKMLALEKDIARQGQHAEMSLCYALYRAFEDLGDYGRAFSYLKRGSDIKRAAIPYDENQSRFHMERIKTLFTRDFIDGFKGHQNFSDLPVFIVGMPRSGTTLTEQIISAHPDAYGAGELTDLTVAEMGVENIFTPATSEKFAEIYLTRIRALAPDAKRITDKMPANFFRIGMIAAAMPNAKIIHCRRNPVDTCLSCYKQLFARGQYWSYDLEELGRYYLLYEEIMQHWRDVLPGRFYEIDYETTVGDFEHQARALIDYVGLPWDDRCLEPHKNKRTVLTASKTQVIKPVYKTSVESWRNYEAQLQPLVKIVAPELAAP